MTYVITYVNAVLDDRSQEGVPMISIGATALREDLYNVIARVNEDCTPIVITNTKGKGAVLVGEDEWAAIEETALSYGSSRNGRVPC